MRLFAFALALLPLAGCKVGKDSVLFVTRTNVAIDLDTAPPTLDIGYKRDELVLAPVDDEGDVLPVMTTVGTSANPFNFTANHSFATGDAAMVMSRLLLSEVGPKLPTSAIDEAALKDLLKGGTIGKDGKRYYFGTNTVLGLGVQWNAEYVPTAIALGYKRKELALVPLGDAVAEDGQTKTDERRLASLIATAHSGTDVGDPQTTRAIIGQTFATGAAATNLALHPEVRRAIGPSVVPNYDQALAERKAIQDADKARIVQGERKAVELAKVDAIRARYAAASPDQKNELVKRASDLGLYAGPVPATPPAEKDFVKALTQRTNGSDPAVLGLLESLEQFQFTSN